MTWWQGRAAFRPKLEKVPLNVLMNFDLSDKLQGSDLLIGVRWDSLKKSPRANEFAGESDTTTHIQKDTERWAGVECVCVCVCVGIGGIAW